MKAPNAAAAAQYYPAIYWYSMLKIPDASQFGPKGIPVKQADYINLMKNNGCVGCHQLGTLATRTIPAAFGTSSKDAWMQRIQAGQAGELMVNIIAGQLQAAPLGYLADWTDRIAKGELPHATPKRPEGIERNVVVTTLDWSDEKHYLHDLISTDKRNPTVNGGGPLYGQPEYSMDYFPVLDLKTNTATLEKAPVRDADMHEMLGPGHAAMEKPLGPSAYWGEEKIWTAHFNNHNATIDDKGRIWMTAAFRDQKNEPDFCKKGSDHPSAKLFPLDQSQRMLIVYDPKTKKFDFVDTCFTTHHLNFDSQRTCCGPRAAAAAAWSAGSTPRSGTRPTMRRSRKAGPRSWSTPAATASAANTPSRTSRADPSKDRRYRPGVLRRQREPGRTARSGERIRSNPGAIVRIDPGSNPPETAMSEIYNVPMPGLRTARRRHRLARACIGRRSAAAIWPRFDRSKCKGPLNGPKATGDHCPEGWTFYQYPGPGFEGIGDNSAEFELLHVGRPATTRSGSATTCRSRPPTSRTAWSR